MNTAATRWFSLRRRLLTALLGGVTLAWLAAMAFSYLDAHHEVDELFDAQLAQTAQTLLALADEREDDHEQDLGDTAHKYQRRLRFQIWRADGSLALRSDNAPSEPMARAGGYAETEDEHGHWRYYSQWNQQRTLQVQVAEDHRTRDELIAHIALRLLIPALFGLPLMGLWIWLATRRGMAPLDELARQIARREPREHQALVPATAPVEIRPMLEALNGLLARVEAALEAERRFTADAAHELRTPLAALLAHTQVALRARDAAERDHALSRLQQGLHQASHLVEQMLQLARLDPQSALPEPQPVALGPLVEAVCAELGPQIIDKRLDFELDAQADCVVQGQPDWLRVLARNLIDNAVRYTPPAGRVAVRIACDASGCSLAVEDGGPGIPVEERPEAMRRFRRLNPSAAPGSGLGLAIVARIAELHGATVCLDEGPDKRGLRVSVTWKSVSGPL